jgi:predicted Fe-S protein YdhL (DUF1289 family)
MTSSSRAILTPCIGICTLDPAGFCDGCFRTGDEIARWSSMSDAERLHLMDCVLPIRETRITGTTLPGESAA